MLHPGQMILSLQRNIGKAVVGKEEAVEYALYWFSIDDELEAEVIGRYTFPYVCDFDECEAIVLRVTRK